MKEYCGSPEYKIWLIGDSNPDCYKKIDYPLDKKHPIRHNIWTSILDEMQDYIYRCCCKEGFYPKRLDTKKIYTRNAVENKSDRAVPSSLIWRKEGLNRKLDELSSLIKNYKPTIIITFGQFPHEFTRRACEKESNPVEYWTKERLGNEFKKSLKNFDIYNINVIPLLHYVIARGDFVGTGKKFIGDENIKCSYFEYVGERIGDLFYKYQEELDIWI
ncbi:hypothetical protein L0P54_11685 [Anaerosalibacter bizertensis]|uniref:Uncharacterized protein n=1 Tax=Anaerosalibacter bizertensis TaxID=932217 RepID=A0A9Q4FMN4_9FIRM|nr:MULTISPECIES: hypothetical protein [Bacillota]MBV1820473.1 hypothetical protein [Bacteroidales bacterium MSK.15.36]MCB5559702.1 hypothetical protein [Anaerosalibacter bizertensis]MCG4566138.1 hypothetical protein [Anaerosalibacter bizertensis]MCG4572854.1 hypothetical protein [Clostridium cochlearium]MCG4583647.1 hypothetical protein [Anaerosalibacter bizertensis]